MNFQNINPKKDTLNSSDREESFSDIVTTERKTTLADQPIENSFKAQPKKKYNTQRDDRSS